LLGSLPTPTSTTNIARKLTVCTDSGVRRRNELGVCTGTCGRQKHDANNTYRYREPEYHKLKIIRDGQSKALGLLTEPKAIKKKESEIRMKSKTYGPQIDILGSTVSL
jgi:hypothetical protein